jgi:hypothetical protein
VSTKEIYTFKGIQKINAANLGHHTHASQYNSQSFVSNDVGDSSCLPPLDTTSFENGTTQQRS